MLGILIPFEFLAGDGVENAVSEEYTSLANRLRQEEYEVETIFRGLAEYDDFQRLFLRHVFNAHL